VEAAMWKLLGESVLAGSYFKQGDPKGAGDIFCLYFREVEHGTSHIYS
jgi:hypothetical protein